MPRDHLRIVEPSPWNKPAAYRPDCIDMLRSKSRVAPSFFATLAADVREIIADIRCSPVSHVLVAIGAVVFWTALLVLPTLFWGAL